MMLMVLGPFFLVLISMAVWGIWLLRAEFKSPSVQGDYTKYRYEAGLQYAGNNRTGWEYAV